MAGRQRLSGTDGRALLRRLHAYVKQRFGTWAAFERQTKTPHATADRWKQKDAVPELPALLQLAKRDPLLDLHHLLTGRRATAWVSAAELHGLLANLDAAVLQSQKLQGQWRPLGVQQLPGRARKRPPQRKKR